MGFFLFLVSLKSAYNMGAQNEMEKIATFERVCRPSSEYGLNDSNVQKIIHSTDLHFDLVINEDFFHESWLMFGYKFNAPLVTICKKLTDFMC